MSTSEVAKALGLSVQRVHQLRQEHDDFPTPVIERPRALWWSAAQMRRWAKAHGYAWEESQ